MAQQESYTSLKNFASYNTKLNLGAQLLYNLPPSPNKWDIVRQSRNVYVDCRHIQIFHNVYTAFDQAPYMDVACSVRASESSL